MYSRLNTFLLEIIMKTYTEWLPEHIQFLKDNHQSMTHQQMADILGKTKKSITHRCSELGLKKDLKNLKVGDRFGKLEVISEQFIKPVGKSQHSYVECRCDCQNIEVIRVQELKSNRRQCIECGKPKYERHPEQRLSPTGQEEMRGGIRFAEYNCECGEIKWIRKQEYLSNGTKSCGCLNQEKRLARSGENNVGYKYGLSKHPIYRVLHNIKNKCYNEKSDNYHGGKIKLFDDWNDINTFYQWALENGWVQGMCVSRKDYEKDYCPDNCYITNKEEIYNKEEVKTNMQEGLKKSLMDKYGVEFSRHIPGVDEKIRKTCNELYGGDTPLSSKAIQDKVKQTNLDKYGQTSVPYELVKDKTIATNRERYGVDYVTQNPETIEKQVATRIKRGLIYVLDGMKAEEWSKKVGIAASTMRKRIKELGFEEAILIPKRQSTIEYLMEKFLKDNNINFQPQKKIEDKYADFVLTDFNLIIEVDGLYWHSDAINADKKYHVKKKEIYERNGYSTMFFREDEMEKKFEIVKSVILNKIGKNVKRVFARKTEIVVLNKKEAREFFEANHLMGRGSGKCYGLRYEGETVSAIRINKRGEGLEISRFCNTINTSVIGGYSKLISHIEKTEKPELIKTFVDLRYGDGEYLKELGFQKIRQHLSFRWVLDDKTFPRQKFTGNTGYDNRCFKIWDCGQALWQKKTPNMSELK